MLVGAAPHQRYGLFRAGDRHERRVEGRVVRPVVAVASRAVHVPHRHVGLDHSEGPRRRPAEALSVLSVAPHRQVPAGEVGDRGRGADRAVHQERLRIARLDHDAGAVVSEPGPGRVGSRPAIDDGRALTDVSLQIVGVVAQVGDLLPARPHRAARHFVGGNDCVVGAVGHDRHEAPPPHDVDPAAPAQRHQPGPDAGRPDTSGVAQAGAHQVVNEDRLSPGLGRQVDASETVADVASGGDWEGLRRLGDLHVEAAPAHQLPIVDGLVAGPGDDAVTDR